MRAQPELEHHGGLPVCSSPHLIRAGKLGIISFPVPQLSLVVVTCQVNVSRQRPLTCSIQAREGNPTRFW